MPIDIYSVMLYIITNININIGGTMDTSTVVIDEICDAILNNASDDEAALDLLFPYDPTVEDLIVMELLGIDQEEL